MELWRLTTQPSQQRRSAPISIEHHLPAVAGLIVGQHLVSVMSDRSHSGMNYAHKAFLRMMHSSLGLPALPNQTVEVTATLPRVLITMAGDSLFDRGRRTSPCRSTSHAFVAAFRDSSTGRRATDGAAEHGVACGRFEG